SASGEGAAPPAARQARADDDARRPEQSSSAAGVAATGARIARTAPLQGFTAGVLPSFLPDERPEGLEPAAEIWIIALPGDASGAGDASDASDASAAGDAGGAAKDGAYDDGAAAAGEDRLGTGALIA